MNQEFDPLSLEVLWQRLLTVADEMTAILLRTSFSTVVGAAYDFACGLMDADGESLAPSTLGMPLFNQTLPNVTKAILAKYGREKIAPGDVFIANDPWINTGHQPDISLLTPFFKGEELLGFTGNTAHHADIGGALDINNVREVYEEGLIIPTTRLYHRGKPNEVVLKFIAANVRVPDIVIGDIHAQLAANKAGCEKALALINEYELDSLTPLAHEIQRRSEAAMCKAIRELADGDYPATVVVDELDEPLTIECLVSVRGESIAVDFTGTSPQQPRGGINVTLSYCRGDTTYALKSILLPDIPSNSGCYRPITVTAPPGCLLNAQHPASLRQRHRVGFYIHRALYLALADVLPSQVAAAPGFQVGTPVFCQPVNRQHLFHAYNFFGGGMGAGLNSDGVSTCMHPSSASNVSIELFEVAVPLLVKRKEYLIDSGGAGRHRGGLGQVVDYRLLPGFEGRATISIWAAGQNIPAFGLAGATGGTPAEITRNGKRLGRKAKLKHSGAFRLDDATEYVGFHTAGGGGYGPPLARDVEQVGQDVRDGLVSPAKARELYGVVVDERTFEVDEESTSLIRNRLKQNAANTT